MSDVITVDSPAALADAVGRTATGEWFEITQERIAAFADAGVTSLQVTPVAEDPVALVGQLKEWVS